MSTAYEPSRKSIFEEASKKLTQEFESLKNIPHNGESGHEAEVILKKFLKSHLPKRYDVASGFILDDSDKVSPQTDVIILDAFNSPVLETFEDNFIIPADNAAVVIEVKSKLRAADIEDAAKKIAATKKLKKSKVQGLGPNTLDTMGILFAFESDMSLEAIAKHYKANIKKHGEDNGQPTGNHIDYIFVLGKGMTNLYAWLADENDAPAPMIMYKGATPQMEMMLLVGFVKYGSKTLDAFLRFLLAHLTIYYPRVSHPGFDLSPEDLDDIGARGAMHLATITSKGAAGADAIAKKFKETQAKPYKRSD